MKSTRTYFLRCVTLMDNKFKWHCDMTGKQCIYIFLFEHSFSIHSVGPIYLHVNTHTREQFNDLSEPQRMNYECKNCILILNIFMCVMQFTFNKSVKMSTNVEKNSWFLISIRFFRAVCEMLNFFACFKRKCLKEFITKGVRDITSLLPAEKKNQNENESKSSLKDFEINSWLSVTEIYILSCGEL